MKKMRGITKVFLLVSLAIIFAASMAGQAKAGTLTFNYDIEFSGGTEPAGTSPWLTATFVDVAGGVDLTLSASNLTGTEFVNDWYFNFDPNLDLSLLNIGYDTGSAGGGTVTKSLDGYKSDGDGYYDILIDYPESSGPGRFESGETATYNITSTESINVSSFNFISYPNGGAGEYFAAAKVQSIAPDGNNLCGNGLAPDPIDGTCSGWVGVVPEPISSTLFIIGGTFLAGRRFFRRKK